MFHADRRTDVTKLTDAFRNFSNAPLNAQTFKGKRIKGSADLHNFLFNCDCVFSVCVSKRFQSSAL